MQISITNQTINFISGSRVNVLESKRTLWQKLRATMKFLYLISDKYDFFFKADDDTYVITDNLYKLLKKMDPDEAFLMGSRYICKVITAYYFRLGHHLAILLRSSICAQSVGVRMYHEPYRNEPSPFSQNWPLKYFETLKKRLEGVAGNTDQVQLAFHASPIPLLRICLFAYLTFPNFLVYIRAIA
ncbi:hypothetical protein P879_02914 [Paragonimus westermani]|uniref:N-acetylgalactosaminide beta-1,3-galactosyltransferase n=1 Tax=Paragonimus westermani TaxID=34504 RepID=A0A8T0DIS6_9TREM|nr:hypothetical protein P879_02914 [Paragonimus westermani]